MSFTGVAGDNPHQVGVAVGVQAGRGVFICLVGRIVGVDVQVGVGVFDGGTGEIIVWVAGEANVTTFASVD